MNAVIIVGNVIVIIVALIVAVVIIDTWLAVERNLKKMPPRWTPYTHNNDGTLKRKTDGQG